MVKEIHKNITIESTDREEFDNKINIMINQGWKIVGSHSIPNKYSQTLVFSYKEDDQIDFFENGFLKNHLSGMWDGESRKYFENGNLKMSYNYKDSERDGEWIKNYENGNCEIKTYYENGLIKGYFGYFSDDGDTILESYSIDLTSIDSDSREYIINDCDLDFGSFTYFFGGKRYSGELMFFSGSGEYDEYDDIDIYSFFEKLIKKGLKSEHKEFIIFDNPHYTETRGYQKYDLISRFETGGWKIKNKLPKNHVKISQYDSTNYKVVIKSFSNNNGILSESEFYVEVLQEESIMNFRIIPEVVTFFVSDSKIMEYKNIINKNDIENHSFSFIGDNIDFRDFFNISGELIFYHNDKEILKINNLLLNNPHNDGYIINYKTIEWSIHNDKSIYNKGSYELIPTYGNKTESDQIKFKRFWNLLYYFEDLDYEKTCKCKITLFNQDDNVIYDNTLYRNHYGLLIDYNIYPTFRYNIIERISKLFKDESGSFKILFDYIIFSPESYEDFLWELYFNEREEGYVNHSQLKKIKLNDFNFNINKVIEDENEFEKRIEKEK